MYYQCRYFKGYEIVDKDTFIMLGNQVWMLFHPEALISLDNIRAWFDRPVIVNNWASGGDLQFRGFRPSDCTVGAKFSQHRLGNAFDLDVQGIAADEVRKVILDNKDNDIRFQYITCLETDISWVHFDMRNIPNRILLVRP